MNKIILLIVSLFSVSIMAQKPVFTQAKVQSATVYFNAAELVQNTNVNLNKGTNEIVVKNVANYLLENTLRIAVPNNVTVMSSQFTQDYLSEFETDPTHPELKKVKDSITLVNKSLQNLNVEKITLQKTIALLDANQKVAGEQSGLNVAELMKLVEFYKTKQTELQAGINIITEKETIWKEILNQLNTKLQAGNPIKEKISNGKLIVQLMSESNQNINLEISYLTQSAGWYPFYDLKANDVKSPIDLLYKGQVYQSTGMDWKNVKLTLSSGNPNQFNQAPILQAWFLQWGYPMDLYQQNAKMNQIQSRKPVLAEVAMAPTSDEGISDFTQIQENQLSISFDIDIPYDILSNNKPHSVTLKNVKLPATYKYYAAPKVDPEAYLLAEIADYSQYNLLPGEANIIFEGMYVGKTNINPNQTADTLQLSMGKDKKLSVKKEKIADKSGTKFLSGYKEQTFTFDITVRNNKKDAVFILLKDQYPLSTDKEIEISLLESSKASVNSETGIITWDVDLKPNETKKFRVSYKVKYPKDKIISNL